MVSGFPVNVLGLFFHTDQTVASFLLCSAPVIRLFPIDPPISSANNCFNQAGRMATIFLSDMTSKPEKGYRSKERVYPSFRKE